MTNKMFARSDEQVSQLGFGCWGIGKSMWIGAEDKESSKALTTAIEEGITLFDTALVYGNGHSEELVGQAERDTGTKIFIATKLPSMKLEWPAKDSSLLEESFPADYIIKMTERSLRNLKRDYIDLQQFHVWNDKWAYRDEWKEAVRKLKESGKVRYFGISMNDHQPWNGIEAGQTGLIDSFQVIFNMFDQSPADELFDFCLNNKISILARVPFDEGSLTGYIKPGTAFPDGDFRNNYFRGDRKEQVYQRVEGIWAEVKDECETMAEAALRYIISFEAVTSVIPGMRSTKNLLANVTSIEKGPLSPATVDKMKYHRWVRNFYA